MRVSGRVQRSVNKKAIGAAEGTYKEIATRYSVSEATVQRIKVEVKNKAFLDGLTLGGSGNGALPASPRPTSMSDLNKLWLVLEQPDEEEVE